MAALLFDPSSLLFFHFSALSSPHHCTIVALLLTYSNLTCPLLPVACPPRPVAVTTSNEEIIIYGPRELLCDISLPTFQQYLKHPNPKIDAIVDAKLSSLLAVLAGAKLITSVKTHSQLVTEQRAVATISWMHAIANSCDSLCTQVCEAIDPDNHLKPLLSVDLFLGIRAARLHSMFLTLLAMPIFKAKLAEAYCDTYEVVTEQFSKGIGISEFSPSLGTRAVA